MNKFEIPDELLESAGIDVKKLSPDALKAMFVKLKEKGLLKDKPADKKSSTKPDGKTSEGSQGSGRPGLVKKKVTVRRGSKTSEEYRWVKAGEDEPKEKKPTGEEPREVPGKSVEPEKPKGPVILGLNKPEGEDDKKDEPKEDVKEKPTEEATPEPEKEKPEPKESEHKDDKPEKETPDDVVSKLKPGMIVDIAGNDRVVKEVDDEHNIVTFEGEGGYSFRAVNKFGKLKDKEPKEPRAKPEKFEMAEHKMTKELDAMEAGLPESAHGMELSLCEFGDNKAIYKYSGDEMDTVGEAGYHDLAETIGWDMVPQTEIVDLGAGEGSCQAFVNGKHPKWSDSDENVVKITEDHFEDIAQIFAMDVLVGNLDRHDENMIIDDDGKVWAIDNDTWTGNAVNYNERDIGYTFDALDYYCGKDVPPGGEGVSKTCRFLSYSLDEAGFKKFRAVLDTKLKEIVEHEQTAKDYYTMDGGERHTDYISDNVKFIKKYLSGDTK